MDDDVVRKYDALAAAYSSRYADPDAVVAFTQLQTRLLFPIQNLLSTGADVEASLALFDRIYEYLDLPIDIVEKADPVQLRTAELLGEVRFEDVSFSYSGHEPWTAQRINLVVPAGTRTAIVGETGAGKTTLGYLVARLYDPQKGRVTIDGVDIRDASLQSLAQTVGVVSQETYLFHASVRENLRFACPDASDEEIEEAAMTAHIHELITTLPDGYDTVVGERGYRLSGGEKQRLAIARVILKDPRILILDEATSALDTTSERLVQRALEPLMAGRTTIAIAHRLSTILAADVIFVLDRGRLVERGTHAELLRRGGLYASLYQQQFKDGLIEARTQDAFVLANGQVLSTAAD